jgi:CRP-like cAMP-binding protein
VTLALRGASGNRLVRARLKASAVLFACYALAGATAAYAPLPADVAALIRTFNPLLVALGLAVLIVVAAVNPWRHDRLPDRFPAIVQDVLVIALFALIAMLFMQERVLATTAVGAVVIGFALQDTLGNLFAGLAIQIDKPFRVGHWVTIGGLDGVVTEVTWRATKLRTKAGNFVVVPNSNVAKETITNYSEPTRDTRIEVQVGVSYDTPPNEVKSVIAAALRDDPLFSHDRAPEVLLTSFDASAINYEARVWTSDFSADSTIRDRMRSHIYYALRRHNIQIPYPIQVAYQHDLGPVPSRPAVAAEALASADILASLTEEQRRQVIDMSERPLYAAGEIIVREGDVGSSMFVIVHGDAVVTLAGTEGELNRLGRGSVFGEMSLLTGERRTATVRALTDCDLLEIGAAAFRDLVLKEPAIVDAVTSAVTMRRAEIERHRATRTSVAAGAPDTHHSFLARVRQFLRLSTS